MSKPKKVSCECGEIYGHQCPKTDFSNRLFAVEVMPIHTEEAKLSQRVMVTRDCGDSLLKSEDYWCVMSILVQIGSELNPVHVVKASSFDRQKDKNCPFVSFLYAMAAKAAPRADIPDLSPPENSVSRLAYTMELVSKEKVNPYAETGLNVIDRFDWNEP